MSLYMDTDSDSDTELSYEEIKPFRCVKCKNRFINQSDLQFHKELVHSRGVFQCAKCDFSCSGIGQITVHNQNHVRENMRIKIDKTPVTILNLNTNVKDQLSNKNRKENDHSQLYRSSKESDQYNINRLRGYNKTQSDKENVNYVRRNIDNSESIESFIIGNTNNNESENSPETYRRQEEKPKDMRKKHKSTNTNVAALINKLMANVIKTEDQFQCHICHKIFVNIWKIKRHLIIHTGEKLFKCTKCSTSFNMKQNLQRHMKTLHNEGIFNCTICQKNFMRKEEMKKHMAIHGNLNSIYYSNSQDKLTSECNRKVHVKKDHTNYTEEEECHVSIDSLMFDKNSLNKPLLIQKEVKPFQCEECDSCFKQKIQLQLHMKKRHNEGMFRCSYCNETFVQKIHMRRHMVIHTDAKTFPCSICQKNFPLEVDLNKHSRKDHQHANIIDNEKLDKFECHYCFKILKTECGLKIHLLGHTGNKPFKCKLCDYTSLQSIPLQNHMMNYHNKGMFKCTYCNETFAQKIYLKRHISEHTGEYPFHCTKCKDKFNLERDLNKHIRKIHRYDED